MAKLDWRGEQQKQRMRNAQVLGVNKTMAECVVWAKNNHGAIAWQNVTGIAEGSIRITGFAVPSMGGARGVWGSVDTVYFRRLELGFDGVDSLGRTVHQLPMPVLRPAADACYPNLSKNIGGAL